MVFSSITFLFYFLPLFLIPYFMLAKQRDRNLLLLAFSLVFYAWGEPIFIFLMVASIYANFFFARAMDRQHDQTHRRYLLALCLLYNLGTLGIFKYTRFLVHVLNRLHVYIPFSYYLRQIPLPIGISFYTFQAVSYVIDVYRKKIPARN